MIRSEDSGRKGFALLRGVLVFLWLSILAGADSRVSVYMLWGLAAGCCAVDNYHRGNRVEGGGKWLLLAACGVFGCIVTLANYALFQPLSTSKLLNALCVTLGGGASAWELLVWLSCRTPVQLPTPEGKRWKDGQVFGVSFGLLAAVYLAYLFFVAWPGVLTSDSVSQLLQIQAEGYTNHHPYWHTMVIRLFVRLGQRVFGSINTGAGLYCGAQACFMAASFAYALMTLHQAGMPRGWLAGVLAGYGLLPYHIVYSVAMWKDIPFAGAMLLLAVALYRCLKGIGRGNHGVLFLSCLACCLWRSNGLMAIAAAGAVYLLALGKKRRTAVALVLLAVVCGWVLKNPVLEAKGVSQPDLVESLSIPLQQVARAIADGAELTPEEAELIDQVVDLEEVPQLYTWYISDPIKDEIRSKDNAYFTEHIGEYGKLWVQLGLRCPVEYLEGWIDQTKGYWNGGYEYWVFPQVWKENDLGITWAHSRNPVAVAFEKGIWLFEVTPGLQWMCAIGLHVWAAVLLGLVAIVRRRQEGWILLPALLVIATLWVATPVSSEFRYAYSLFTVLPFAVPAVLGKVKE